MKKKITNKRTAVSFIITLFIIVLCACASSSDIGDCTLKVVPPAQGAYHSAFPDFSNEQGNEDQVSDQLITDFENLAQKKIAWAYFSNNWIDGIHFPTESVEIIHNHGCIPFIRMLAISTEERICPEPVYTLQRIIDGDFDADLREWAQDARATNFPLMVEFGTEVNGEWFPWNGKWNGGGETDGYGDPTQPDGPERFRDAYHHIVDICRQEGVQNITWVYHVNYDSQPPESWNTYAAYYPGDDYIDWIGISVYGAQIPGDEWHLFSELLDIAYPELIALSPDKPLAVLEYGVVEDPNIGDKAAWIHDAISSVRVGRYPRIVSMSWWHEDWENGDGSISNLRIDSSPEALAAYQQEIADPFFISEPNYSQ